MKAAAVAKLEATVLVRVHATRFPCQGQRVGVIVSGGNVDLRAYAGFLA